MDNPIQPRQYLIDSERPYAEVVTIMNSLATLMPFNPKGEEKDNGKK